MWPIWSFQQGLHSKGGSTVARKCTEAIGPPARVYSLVPGGPEGDSNVVTSTIPILGFKALVLFHSGLPITLYLVCL
jgi:hypothetical protein